MMFYEYASNLHEKAKEFYKEFYEKIKKLDIIGKGREENSTLFDT